MTNEFSGHITLRLYRKAALEHQNHKPLCLTCSALLCDKSDALSAPEKPFVMGIKPIVGTP